jgi:predicted DNA-binding transcriptional regulator YafY
VRGRYGGYRLARHYRMPPLMLTDEEGLAVVWGLLLGRQSASGPASLSAVRSAVAKVRRVLPAVLAGRIDAVIETVGFTAREEDINDGPDRSGDDGSARVLLVLAEAARDRRPVTFGYTARQGRTTQRSVQPHGVVAHRGRLYLTGFDVTRHALRTFRLDRIDRAHRHRPRAAGRRSTVADALAPRGVVPHPGRHRPFTHPHTGDAWRR